MSCHIRRKQFAPLKYADTIYFTFLYSYDSELFVYFFSYKEFVLVIPNKKLNQNKLPKL